MTILNKLKEAYDEAPDYNREAIQFAATHATGAIIFDLLRTAIIYKIGRKVCPEIFSSYGKTYAIAYAVRLAVRETTLTDSQKERLKTLKKKQEDAKLDAYYRSEEFANVLRRTTGSSEK